MEIIKNQKHERPDDGRVDITKLSYTDDYESYLGTKANAATNRLNNLQYLRFMAIIAILESIVFDYVIQNDFVWAAVALTSIIIATIVGRFLFESFLKSINLALLSTLILATLYYFKHK